MITKICQGCGKKYTPTSNRQKLCLTCRRKRRTEGQKEYMKEYRKTHPEQRREYSKKYRKTHAEQERKRARQYYKEHIEQKREYQKKYYKAHPEIVAIQRARRVHLKNLEIPPLVRLGKVVCEYQVERRKDKNSIPCAFNIDKFCILEGLGPCPNIVKEQELNKSHDQAVKERAENRAKVLKQFLKIS
jgi:hypothetical protein